MVTLVSMILNENVKFMDDRHLISNLGYAYILFKLTNILNGIRLGYKIHWR